MRLLSNEAVCPPTHGINSGIKLPNINVPTFDGDVLNQNSFWKQFNVAIHSKVQLNDAERLAYLRDVLKDGPARHVLEGLSQDADYHNGAIGCLHGDYDRPHLIHQAHVDAIYEALSFRDSNSRKLRHLHDVAAPQCSRP